MVKHVLKEKERKLPKAFDYYGTTSSAKDEIAALFGDACFELNKEDYGNRKFILVCNDENDTCKKVSNERLKASSIKNQGNYCFCDCKKFGNDFSPFCNIEILHFIENRLLVI